MRPFVVVVALAATSTLTACGSSGSSAPSGPSSSSAPSSSASSSSASSGSSQPAARTAAGRAAASPTAPGRPAPALPIRLRAAHALAPLPAARSGIAAAAFRSSVVVSGGLSAAGQSTDTVFQIAQRGSAATLPGLPGPVHDAAAVELGGRLLLFGGGQFEGSDRIVSVLPGRPRQVGTLPQALSDLDAVAIGAVAYVVGGWNGSDTNRDIYAVGPSGRVRVVGRLPVGVRYPAAAALAGRVIVAGGETASGSPTAAAWSFDPQTGAVTRLPDLPAATDHTAGAPLAGRVYVVGGLRNGAFTRAILSWAPGERRWRSAGQLSSPLADEGAVPFGGGIAVLGGRGSAGKLARVTLMMPA